MLYVFYGSDHKEINKQSGKLIAALQVKRPDAEVVRLETPLNEDKLKVYISAQGLFYTNSIVILEQPFSHKESSAAIRSLKKDLVESPSLFVIIDRDIDGNTAKSLAKAGAQVKEYGAKLKSYEFNVFALTDHLLNLDDSKLWLGLQQAKKAGIEAEHIFGTFWWQIKTLILAHQSASAAEAGLSPFVFNKARRSKIGEQKAKEILNQLIDLQIEYKTTSQSLWVGLENFALGLK